MARLSGLSLLLAASIGLAAPASAKPIIALNIAQGWPNDFVASTYTAVNQPSPVGQAAVENMIGVLQVYQQAGYTVCALVNPQAAFAPQTNLGALTPIQAKQQVIYVLDRLKARGVPFMLDVISSDSLPGPNKLGSAPGNAPVSPNTGMPVWNNYGGDATNPFGIQYYISNYPNLMGFRIHEPEWIFQQYDNVGWGAMNALPQIESFVSMAAQEWKNNQRFIFIQYNSTVWDNPTTAYANPPAPDCIQAARNSAQWLAQKYAGFIFTTWATNDGTNIARLSPPSTPWRSLVNFTGVAGLGVSDQSWMTGLWLANPPYNTYPPPGGWATSSNCPSSALISWVNDALTPNSNYPATGIMQFEPFWYFFNPVGSTKNGTPTNGTANLNQNQIAWALGIALPYQ